MQFKLATVYVLSRLCLEMGLEGYWDGWGKRNPMIMIRYNGAQVDNEYSSSRLLSMFCRGFV